MRVWPALPVLFVAIAAIVGNAEAQWRSARYYGGSDYEFAAHLVVDAEGSSYFLGQTYSSDMDPSIVPASRGGPAMATFVYKLSPQGTPVYATTVGTGFFLMRPVDLAVGADGSAHLLLIDGDNVRYVIQLDAGGRERARAAISPRATEWYAQAIAVDSEGNSIVAGGVTGGGAFVVRIDGRGVMSHVYRLQASALVNDVAIDAAGNIYLLGVAQAGDLPITAGAFQQQFKAGACPHPEKPTLTDSCTDAFILKVTRTGTVVYATYFGGAGSEDGGAIAVDHTGSAIISGNTRSADLPLVAPVKAQCTNRLLLLPCGEGYIAKLDPRGGALVFSTYAAATAPRLTVDAAGTVYAGGATSRSSGLPIHRAPQPDFGGGDSDGYVTAYSSGGQLLWSTYVGGSREEAVAGIGIAGGFVYFGGQTTSAEFATGGSPFHGARDLFLGRVFDPLAPGSAIRLTRR
jgi:hypothetical protein